MLTQQTFPNLNIFSKIQINAILTTKTHPNNTKDEEKWGPKKRWKCEQKTTKMAIGNNNEIKKRHLKYQRH
jgi:hypothetical protein